MNSRLGESSRRRASARSRSSTSATQQANSNRNRILKTLNVSALLTQPLSQHPLVSHIPVFDIEAHVNRSSETRRAEQWVGKNPGKVGRPPNAFILYRKAYIAHAVELVASQVRSRAQQGASLVMGASWKREPQHVRDRFAQWAAVEAANHKIAFPDWKFLPRTSKPQARRQSFSDSSDEEDEADSSLAEDNIKVKGISPASTLTSTPALTLSSAASVFSPFMFSGPEFPPLPAPQTAFQQELYSHIQTLDARLTECDVWVQRVSLWRAQLAAQRRVATAQFNSVGVLHPFPAPPAMDLSGVDFSSHDFPTAEDYLLAPLASDIECDPFGYPKPPTVHEASMDMVEHDPLLSCFEGLEYQIPADENLDL